MTVVDHEVIELIDDLLGVWGDPLTTGKPVYADLARRKKSPAIVMALESASPAGMELRDLYGCDRSDAQVLRRMATLIEHTGARAWAESKAREELTAAHNCLSSLEPSEAALELRLLASLVADSS